MQTDFDRYIQNSLRLGYYIDASKYAVNWEPTSIGKRLRPIQVQNYVRRLLSRQKFRDFLTRPGKFRVVPQIKPRLFPSPLFPIHHSLIALSFDAI
jgi:hypothetical protein